MKNLTEQERMILEEAENIYHNAVNYYNALKGDPRSSDTMMQCAEKSMLEAYKHLLDMRYEIGFEKTGYGAMD